MEKLIIFLMNYKVGDRVIIKNIPIYSDIINNIEEYFINKNGFIVNIIDGHNAVFRHNCYFDINISGKIYTFDSDGFVLDVVFYRNLKLEKILDVE